MGRLNKREHTTKKKLSHKIRWYTSVRFFFVECHFQLNSISVISWQPVLLAEEIGVPGENR